MLSTNGFSGKRAINAGLDDLEHPLNRAYLDNAVYVMNSFRVRLVGSKMNFAIARSPLFETWCAEEGIVLEPEEKNALEEYIPETIVWGTEMLDDRSPGELSELVFDDVSNWVVKGIHGKGGRGIY